MRPHSQWYEVNINMHMSDIKSFLAVVEFHSISLASKRMHISQPTMTRRIQKIEQELGTPLFFSSGIRTELTAKGKELLPYFRQMLDIYQQMYINVGNKTKNPLKLINVGTSVYVANSIIQDFMHSEEISSSNYFFNIKLLAEPYIIDSLNSGEYDLIIAPPVYDCSSSVISIPLWKEKILAVVGANHPLARNKKPISITELMSHDVALMEKGFTLRKKLDSLSEGLHTPLKAIFESNSIYNNIALVEKGVGWCLIHERLLNPNLISVELSDCNMEIEFHCSFLKRREDERLIWQFLEQIRKWILADYLKQYACM